MNFLTRRAGFARRVSGRQWSSGTSTMTIWPQVSGEPVIWMW